jgi:hypothetical protein
MPLPPATGCPLPVHSVSPAPESLDDYKKGAWMAIAGGNKRGVCDGCVSLIEAKDERLSNYTYNPNKKEVKRRVVKVKKPAKRTP